MQCRAWLAAALIAALVPKAGAEPATPVRIDISLEQPAYTHMPVWLDVTVHDVCLANDLGPDGSFPLWGAPVEVKGPGEAVPPPGFEPDISPGMRITGPFPACPDKKPTGNFKAHRFPLHVVAAFTQPGTYKVRWVMPTFAADNLSAQSFWLNFNVTASTPEQRNAWLRNMLAHVPSDEEAITQDYVPSLLVALGDPRVTRQMLDFLCSPDERISNTVSDTFFAGLDPSAQSYLIQLVDKGCITPGLIYYIARHHPGDESMRPELTRAAIGRLDTASLADLQSLIGLLGSLSYGIPLDGHFDSTARAAAVGILRNAPKILHSQDDTAKYKLTDYLFRYAAMPGAHEVLRALALQQGRASERAVADLIDLDDPAELPTVADRLSGPPDGLVLSDFESLIGDLAREAGKSPLSIQAAQATLHDLMNRAMVAEVRDDAALALAKSGDAAGIKALIQVLRNGGDDEADTVLRQLSANDVACRGSQSDCYDVVARAPDPCPCPIRLRKDIAINYFAYKAMTARQP